MLNKSIKIGRLVDDPELRYTSNGKPVANFTLACDRKYNDDKTDFIPCVTWGKRAEDLCKYKKKGDMILVEGFLQIRKNKKNGRTYKNPEVVCLDITYMPISREEKRKRKKEADTEEEVKKNVEKYNEEIKKDNKVPGGEESDFSVPF